MLDLVLESIKLNLKGYNKIYVFYESSDEIFLKGYEITKKKYIKIFGQKIFFIRKKSLAHTTELFYRFIENDILILTDDSLIFKNYDLLDDPASKAFYKEDKIISNSLRHSVDMIDQLPSNERLTNKIKDDGTNINNQIFNFSKPHFINFKFSDHVDKETNNVIPNYGIWNIYDNLNSTPYSSFLNPSLQIFRKNDFLKWLEKYSKDKSFLNITDALYFEYYPKIIRSRIILFFLNKIDYIYHFICNKISKKKVRPSHLFKNFFASYFSKTKKIDFPHLMCCPKEQVGFDYDIGSYHQNQNTLIFEKLNKNYLEGFEIDYEKFVKIKKNFPFYHITLDQEYFLNNLIKKNEKK